MGTELRGRWGDNGRIVQHNLTMAYNLFLALDGSSQPPLALTCLLKAAEEVAAAKSITGAFGQKQAMYANRHISAFIDVFRVAREKEGGTVGSCTKLLEDMIAIARFKHNFG